MAAIKALHIETGRLLLIGACWELSRLRGKSEDLLPNTAVARNSSMSAPETTNSLPAATRDEVVALTDAM